MAFRLMWKASCSCDGRTCRAAKPSVCEIFHGEKPPIDIAAVLLSLEISKEISKDQKT